MLDLEDQKFNSIESNVDVLGDLIEQIKKNRVVPFVGAGMSYDIYGSWGEALKLIMKGRIHRGKLAEIQEMISNEDYYNAADKIKEGIGLTCYEEQLVHLFGEHLINDEKLKTMPVRFIPRIFTDTLVVTTNYDKVLEQVFLMEQHSFVEKVALRHLTRWQAENSQRGKLHYLIKIHGCISAPDEVVMTKTSYDELYNTELQHIARLRSIISSNNLLFIGCSLGKDRTVDLLREIGLGNHYAILEMNGEIDDDIFQNRKLSMSDDLKMHCIWYPKGEHNYVEDILEYIYADITGQLKEVVSAAPKDSNVKRNPSTAPTKKPDKVSRQVMKPLVKNETHTIGHWNGKPMEWLILDVQSDRALLITKACLMKALYNEEDEDVTWESCTLRNKLLPELLERVFDDAERDKVMLVNNKNPKNDYSDTPGGADTKDKLFLLSTDEAKQYFPYDQARIASLDGEAVWWWLRSPGDYGFHAADVSPDGSVNDLGHDVGWAGGAVRPAFWLNLQS